MATDTQLDSVYKATGNGAWIQVDGPGTRPLLIGCGEVADIAEPTGDISLIQCVNAFGQYITVDSTQAAPTPVTTTVTTYTEKTRSALEQIRCAFAFYVLLNCNGKRKDVWGNYERGYRVVGGTITNKTYMGLVTRATQTASEIAFDLSFLPPVTSFFRWSAIRQPIAETEDLNAILFCNSPTCQNSCATSRDGCQDGFIVTDAAGGGSPANVANVWGTSNGGGDWDITATNPFGAGENIIAGGCFDFGRDTVRWVVVRGTTDVGNPAEVAISDDGGATWKQVDVGSVNGQFAATANSLFILDQNNIWLATTGGYIYYSSDAGETWTSQNEAEVTAGQYNAIYFADSRYGIAGANTGVIAFTIDGGVTWAQLTGYTDVDNVLSVTAHTSRLFWATTSGGNAYISFDAGANWALRPFANSGTGSVPDQSWLNSYTGAMIHTVGGVSTLQTTVDGGWTWELMPGVPTNSGLNDVFFCSESLLFAVGNANGGTGVIVKAISG